MREMPAPAVALLLVLTFQIQATKIVAPAPAAEDRFGWSVAVNGRTLVAGAPQDLQPGGAGVAHVFVRIAGSWVAQSTLVPPGLEPGSIFGSAVVLDGDLIAVGATGDDTAAGTNAGSVHIFARNDAGTPADPVDDSWALGAMVTPADASAFDLFGVSVDLDDGVMVAGAWGESTFGNLAGSVYVFRQVAGAWVQEAKLFASDAGAGDRFGASVAVALAGSELKPTHRFGSAVSLSGGRLAVGAHQFPTGPGAVFLWEREGRRWTERGRFAASDGALGDAFGFSVALDHFRMAAGAPLAAVAGPSAGATYVFDVLTPQEQLDAVIDDVQDLVDADTLNRGQGTSLLARLNAALQALAQDNITVAIQQMQSFVRQVEAFAGAGLVSPQEASALVAAANALIARLQE